jgi:hypothetical protein
MRNNTNAQTQRNKKSVLQKPKQAMTSVSISKIDESYNTDKANDILIKDYEPVINKIETRSPNQDIPSENSFTNNTNRVSNNFI